MSIFKKIDPSDVRNYETHIQSDVTLNQNNTNTKHFVSRSINDSTRNSVNANYWDLFKGNFFSTGSFPHNKSLNHGLQNYSYKGQHKNKFYTSGSVVSISQKYYDENIVPGTFRITDTFYSSSVDNTINPIIVDDTFGNLYSTNAYHSQSTNHASHSDNYVGNLFYEMGMAVFTETGSWSGSLTYMDLFKNNHNVSFKSQHTLYSTEYNLHIEPNEFLHTSNPTSRGYISGSTSRQSPYYKTWLTGSLTHGDGFTHFTTIGLYDMNDTDSGPLMIARLPRAIKSHGKVPITLKLKFDKMII